MYARTVPTLGAYARDYGTWHPVVPGTLHQLRIAADLFERWAGGPVRVDELDERSVATWLREVAMDRAPATVRSKRNNLLALWRAASDDGLCEPPARRIRVAPAPHRNPTAWTLAEVEQLQEAALGLGRWHPCGLPRAAWWVLAIRVAWATGLRWGDQVRLPLEEVTADGQVAHLQSKTRRVVVRTIDPDTLRLLRDSLQVAPRRLVTPWPATHQAFSRQFHRVVQQAGVRPGTWKWLRRAGVTGAEAERPGAGAAHAGHAPGSPVTARAYIDRTQLGLDAAGPRPLQPVAARIVW